MEYEHRPADHKHPHVFYFEGWETEVVKAAYTEQANRHVVHNNTDLVTDFDEWVILFPDSEEKKLGIKSSKSDSVSRVLETYSALTTKAMVDIANLPIPAYENHHPAKRRQLGRWATELALDMRRKVEAASAGSAAEPEGEFGRRAPSAEDVELMVRELSQDLENGIPGDLLGDT